MVLPKRSRRTDATRAAILGAVRRLVTAHGFDQTSIKDIARAAEVAIQTIYDLFGSKAGVLLALTDVVGRQAEIPSMASLAAIEDPVELLAALAGIRRRLLERCGDVLGAARTTTDPELRAARAEGRRRHERGVKMMVGRLRAARALRRGMTDARAAAIIDALTVEDAWDALVVHHRWTPAEYQEWLASALATAVLEPKRTGRRK